MYVRKPEAETTPEEWTSLIHKSDSPDEITPRLYQRYVESPHSRYTPPSQDSAFGYDYHPDTKTVKIHFTNPRRGESPFSSENMPQRRQEFKAMLQDVISNHPDAQNLMSASWIRSTSHYRSLSPDDISEQQSLMSPDMNFGGDSLWGQFIDRNGNTNQRVYDQFVAAVEQAKTIEELLAALPYKTLMANDPIEKYYDFYGISSSESE